jgi:hypothetical protein
VVTREEKLAKLTADGLPASEADQEEQAMSTPIDMRLESDTTRPLTDDEYAAALAACDPEACDGCRPAREASGGGIYLICDECRAKRSEATRTLRGHP